MRGRLITIIRPGYDFPNLCFRESHLQAQEQRDGVICLVLRWRVKQKATPVRFAFREEFVVAD